jgi:hypothetical protein
MVVGAYSGIWEDVMPRQGNSFHRLVHAIERSIVNNPNVRIEAPKMISDKDTGRLR